MVFFKLGADGDIRVSMRSKYDVDVRRVAGRHGGGGHKNAAGFTVGGPLDHVRAGILQEIEQAIAAGMESRPQESNDYRRATSKDKNWGSACESGVASVGLDGG